MDDLLYFSHKISLLSYFYLDSNYAWCIRDHGSEIHPFVGAVEGGRRFSLHADRGSGSTKRYQQEGRMPWTSLRGKYLLSYTL